jgi:hypothetical protein
MMRRHFGFTGRALVAAALAAGVLSATELAGGAGARAAAPHRIRVRQVNGAGEFYDTVTGQKFIPRGNNYIRLAWQTDWGGQSVFYHSTFDPGRYDAARADAALVKMRQDGYNVVRVFLNDIAIGATPSGLNSAYLANLTDFLVRAKAQSIYTQITLVFLPKNGTYYVSNQNPAQIEGENWFYMAPEAVDAKKRYARDLVNGLIARNAPLDYVFSYNIENEAYFREDLKPVSLTGGTVSTLAGTFNPGTQKQQMMDANLVQWINQVRSAIRAVDSTALVAPGFFAPRAVTGSDPRIIRTYWAIADPAVGGSSADYVDLHSYPVGQTLGADVASFEISTNKKPLVMGEFGAFKSVWPNLTNAAYALRDWQIASCNQYGFDGWLLWTWDTSEQAELWNCMDSNGAINGVLAPIVRPNPGQ